MDYWLVDSKPLKMVYRSQAMYHPHRLKQNKPYYILKLNANLYLGQYVAQSCCSCAAAHLNISIYKLILPDICQKAIKSCFKFFVSLYKLV